MSKEEKNRDTEFRKDAPPAIDKMLAFMNNLFQN